MPTYLPSKSPASSVGSFLRTMDSYVDEGRSKDEKHYRLFPHN
jgi:hypothetical protein